MNNVKFQASEGDQYVVAVVRRTGDRVEAYFDGPFSDAEQAQRVADQERYGTNGLARVEVMGVR